MSCAVCGSEKLGQFPAEVALHVCELLDSIKRPVFVFPAVTACLNCGRAEFAVPKDELHALEKARDSGFGARIA